MGYKYFTQNIDLETLTVSAPQLEAFSYLNGEPAYTFWDGTNIYYYAGSWLYWDGANIQSSVAPDLLGDWLDWWWSRRSDLATSYADGLLFAKIVDMGTGYFWSLNQVTGALTKDRVYSSAPVTNPYGYWLSAIAGVGRYGNYAVAWTYYSVAVWGPGGIKPLRRVQRPDNTRDGAPRIKNTNSASAAGQMASRIMSAGNSFW